ncbi:MAG: RadC family protein [Chloroflexia bacterium]
MRDMPPSELPRERLCSLGASALSDAELLAILLRTGAPGHTALDLARDLLMRYGGLEGLLRASPGELAHERGIGLAKAAQVKAALELGRRLLLVSPGERTVIRTPDDAARLLRAEMGYLEQEQVRALLLDARHHLLRQVLVYQGSTRSAVVRIGELFREAVRENASALIVAHNHPSGDPTPSPEDIALTREIVHAGTLLGIDLLDHLVIARQRYVSLRERRLGFDG